MDVINFFVVIASFINLGLSVFLFYHAVKTKSISVRYFGYFALSVTAWCISIFFYRSVGQDLVVIWGKILYFTASFTPTTFFLFALSFKDKKVNPAIERGIYAFNFLLGFSILFTPYLISAVTIPVDGERIISFGALYYWVYAVYIPLGFTTAFSYLGYKAIKSKKQERNQLIFILIGSVSTSTLAMVTNLTLPTFGNFSLNWFGQISTIIWLSAVSYSIVRYSLFDIRVLIGRITYYLILGVISYISYYFFSFISISLFGSIYAVGSYIIGIVNAALFVLFFDASRRFFQEQITVKFINPGYDPKDIVNNLNSLLNTTLDIEEISQTTLKALSKTFRSNYEGILILDEVHRIYSDYSNPVDISKIRLAAKVFDLMPNQYILRELEEQEAQLVPAELKTDFQSLIEEMHKSDIRLIIPIINQESKRLGLILMGSKEANEGYSSSEIELIKDMSNAYSAAYTRWIYHREVQELNVNLQKRVEEATEELKNKNQSLEVALTQIEEIRRQEKDMIDVMGHELRTPITIVRNALMFLDTSYKTTSGDIDKEKLREYLDMALESAKREINLVETLLSATKVDADKMLVAHEKIDLIDVVNDSLVGFGGSAKNKGLELIYNPPTEKDPDNWTAFGDRTRAQEVLDNLVSNSVKYTEKGNVRIILERFNQDFYKLSVKDTGIGIDEEDIKNLGKKFFRAKQYIQGEKEGVVRPGGTGLGLYVVFEIVAKMGGEIDIQSKVGEGSTFSFTLPVYKGQELTKGNLGINERKNVGFIDFEQLKKERQEQSEKYSLEPMYTKDNKKDPLDPNKNSKK